MNKSFDVFLSHNSKDKPAVRELAEALKRRGLKVWLDEWELVPGLPWQEALEKIILTVRCAAVLVGKDGFGPWEVPELRGCLSEFVTRKLPVIPVLLPGAPQEPELPLFLKQLTWVDLRDGLTKSNLDRLRWGITGKKPSRTRSKRSTPKPAEVRDLSSERKTKALRAVARERVAADQKAAGSAVLGQPFTEPITGIRFLWIPGGRFRMDAGYGWYNWRELVWVRISPFWLAEMPVSNRQYTVFLEQTGGQEPDYWHDQRFSSPDQPVVGVSWEDAQTFCRWLTKSDRQVMLPSEAQWEFAARGSDGRKYPWGNKPPDEARACFDAKQPAPVGSFPAGRGPFGILDQAGNVWEWCRDAWSSYTNVKQEGDPVNPVRGEELTGEGVERVLRGGSYTNPAEFLRADYRTRNPAGVGHVTIGFRVATIPVICLPEEFRVDGA